MARKTLKRRNSRGSRKTGGSRRMKGGALALSPADVDAGIVGDAGINLNAEANVELSSNPGVSGSVDLQLGGKRRKGRKGKKGSKKATKKATKKVGKKVGKKRKVNAFFKLMMNAKKSGAPSFSYNGKTYKKRTKGPLTFYKA